MNRVRTHATAARGGGVYFLGIGLEPEVSGNPFLQGHGASATFGLQQFPSPVYTRYLFIDLSEREMNTQLFVLPALQGDCLGRDSNPEPGICIVTLVGTRRVAKKTTLRLLKASSVSEIGVPAHPTCRSCWTIFMKIGKSTFQETDTEL